MKVICKIIEHYPETNQIVVAIGRLHSHQPIDEHIRVSVSYNNLDMTDFESFKCSLIQMIYTNIQDSDDKHPILDENKPVEIDELDIDKLVGKVFSGEYVNKSTRLLKMRRVKL